MNYVSKEEMLKLKKDIVEETVSEITNQVKSLLSKAVVEIEHLKQEIWTLKKESRENGRTLSKVVHQVANNSVYKENSDYHKPPTPVNMPQPLNIPKTPQITQKNYLPKTPKWKQKQIILKQSIANLIGGQQIFKHIEKNCSGTNNVDICKEIDVSIMSIQRTALKKT